MSIKRRCCSAITQLQACTAYAGPLSEIGEVRDATEDTHSIYGDSDLMSSDGRDQVGGCSRAFLLLIKRPRCRLLSNSLDFWDVDMTLAGQQAVMRHSCYSLLNCML